LADDASVVADYWSAMARHDVRRRLPGIGVPTTVVAARGDRSVDVAEMRAVADAVPGARFDVVPGPHLFVLEAPAVMAAVVARHLDRVARIEEDR